MGESEEEVYKRFVEPFQYSDKDIRQITERTLRKLEVEGEKYDWNKLFDTFRRKMLLTERDLTAGNKILDIGAGSREFAAACAMLGKEVDVWSLEPSLIHTGARDVGAPGTLAVSKYLNRQLSPEVKRLLDSRSVAASYEALPFPDNAFDLVVSTGAFPMVMIHTKEAIKHFFDEASRVVKPGGQIRCHPYFLGQPKELSAYPEVETEEVLDTLRKRGFMTKGIAYHASDPRIQVESIGVLVVEKPRK